MEEVDTDKEFLEEKEILRRTKAFPGMRKARETIARLENTNEQNYNIVQEDYENQNK